MRVETITKEELLPLVGNRDVIVLNALPRDWYERAHIPGSICIPVEELSAKLAELPRELIITYCASFECTSSLEAAELLARHGYNVKAYRGGTKERIEARLPWEGTARSG